MSLPNYTILYKDEETKNIVLRITDTALAGVLLDVVLDEWVSEENLDAKLRADVVQLQNPDYVSNVSLPLSEEAEEL
jgi:hypothetical protein